MTALEASTIAEIDQALGTWCQGDVARAEWTAWFANGDVPLTDAAGQAGVLKQAGGTALMRVAAEGLVVVTQTCDIVRSCADRPFIQLSPLVRLDDGTAAQARRAMRPRYAHVPLLGDDAFADLDRILTVEKSLVAEWERTPGLASDSEQRRFAQGVARKFSRFAFPDDLVKSLSGLVSRVKDKHGRDSKEGRALEALEEIRATGAPSWEEDTVDVFLTFSPPTREEADALLPVDEWDALIDSWLDRCEPRGRVRNVDGAMIPLDELTAREYVDSDLLDLDHLSV